MSPEGAKRYKHIFFLFFYCRTVILDQFKRNKSTASSLTHTTRMRHVNYNDDYKSTPWEGPPSHKLDAVQIQITQMAQ